MSFNSNQALTDSTVNNQHSSRRNSSTKLNTESTNTRLQMAETESSDSVNKSKGKNEEAENDNSKQNGKINEQDEEDGEKPVSTPRKSYKYPEPPIIFKDVDVS